MFKIYLKIAARNLWRNKTISIINIFGLAVGIATCLLILLYVTHELSFDRFNENADRIVRVVFNGEVQGEKMREANVMPPVAKTLLRDYPQVQDATRLMSAGAPMITVGNDTYKEELGFADPNFFNVFTLPLLQGNKKTALLQPNAVIISASVAKKFFNNENAVGQVLSIKSWNKTYIVSAVMKDIPATSHFHFDLLGSMLSVPDAQSDSWMTSNFYTYLLLRNKSDLPALQASMPQVVDKYMGPQVRQAMGINLEQFRQQGNNLGFILQPLTDIHLHSDFTGDLKPYGDIRYIYFFSAIALFMLVIACINFINLSTASASKRAREVGVRKVLGSARGQLIRQFLTESLLVSLVAMILALALVKVALPLFTQLAAKQFDTDLFSHTWLLPALLLIGLVTGLAAGSYPALFLSSFNPVAVLKGKINSTKRGQWLRSSLVVFQFFISITLIIATAVVFKQLSYVNNKKPGYEKDNVLILPDTHLLGDKQAFFRQQLIADPRVAAVTASGYLPAGPTYANNFFLYGDEQASQIKTLRYQVEPNYIDIMGMQMAYGRNFSTDLATDSSAIILNETAARAFGWPKNAIGHVLEHRDNNGQRQLYQVVGVVKDFHFKSLHQRISPLVMTLGNNNGGGLIVKLNTADIAGLLATIKNQWNTLNVEAPFAYSFLNDRYSNTYQAEMNTGVLMGVFASLTIFIACMGLFGLAIFTALQRTREIGIRKVLGATATSIVGMLSKDFLRLVVIAFVVAAPVAWLLMNKWLQNFAYRTTIGWQTFAFAAIAASCIALFAIGYQAVKASLANPVKSLRSEG